MRLSQQTLMHEVRETPSPLDGQHIAVNPPRFMWPDKYPHLGAVLDGVEEEDFKPEVTYRIRIARDPEFKSEVITAERGILQSFQIVRERKMVLAARIR